MARAKLKVFVVQKFFWWYNDEYWSGLGDGDPIRTFRDRGRAEAYRMELERAARREKGICPFDINGLGLEDQTSLSESEFRRRLSAAGIDGPGVGEYFRSWWDDVEATLTEEQRDLVWDLLDLAQFYRVEETEIEVEQ
jgi:hypothetical protein